MRIQWFPGHMTKTRRQIQDTIRQVDVVIELLDARIPFSSRNPDIDWLVGQKPRVVALNKSDLADESVNRQWEAWFKAQGMEVVHTNALSGSGLKEIHRQLKDITATKLASAVRRGRLQRPIRTMVVGIPNVGKSAFINRIAGKSVASTGDKPGVTRAQQWVRIHPEIQLLDTPGILWPRFEDPETGMVLAYTGAIRDDIMDTTELAASLMTRLATLYPERLAQRYKLASVVDRAGMDLLLEAGRRRGCLIAGGEVDLHRISAIVLDEFRGAKLGRISLERPPEKPIRNTGARITDTDMSKRESTASEEGREKDSLPDEEGSLPDEKDSLPDEESSLPDEEGLLLDEEDFEGDPSMDEESTGVDLEDMNRTQFPTEE